MRKFSRSFVHFLILMIGFGFFASSCMQAKCGSTAKKRKAVRYYNSLQYR